MSIKLIASDLDGTMVGDDNIVSKANLKAINKINSKNINLDICTGKTYQITKSFCQEFNAKYGIFNNGSQIYDLTTGEKLFSLALSLDEIKKCIDIARENKFHVHVYSDDELITEKLKYLDLRNFKLLNTTGFKFVIIDEIVIVTGNNDSRRVVIMLIRASTIFVSSSKKPETLIVTLCWMIPLSNLKRLNLIILNMLLNNILNGFE